MKKHLLMTMMTTAVLLACSSCGGNSGKIRIGILQYATHDALTKAKDGFIDELARAGYGEDEVTFIVRNPEGDPSSMQQMSTYLESQNLDLVFGIATPAAISLKNAFDANGNDTPILFSAVTDAVDAGLVSSNEHPGGNITGTSDMNPVAEQIDLLLEVDPTIETVGILYTSSENNSKIQSDLAVERCEALNKQTVVATTENSSNIATVASSLISRVDAIYIPTDNIIASNMNTVIQAAQTAGKSMPICVGEEGMMTGGVVTLALDYTVLGNQTGKMAADILSGAKEAGDIAVEMQESFKLIVNLQIAEELNVTVPSAIIDRADEVIR